MPRLETPRLISADLSRTERLKNRIFAMKERLASQDRGCRDFPAIIYFNNDRRTRARHRSEMQTLP